MRRRIGEGAALVNQMGPGTSLLVCALSVSHDSTTSRSTLLEPSASNFHDRLGPLSTVGTVNYNIVGCCHALFIGCRLGTILQLEGYWLLLWLQLLLRTLGSSALPAAHWLLLLVWLLVHNLNALGSDRLTWRNICWVHGTSDQQIKALSTDIFVVGNIVAILQWNSVCIGLPLL